MNAVTKFPAVLEGEILGSGTDIRVLVQAHPFAAKKKEFTVPAGTTLREIYQKITNRALAPSGHSGFDVRIFGEIIYPELWDRVRPKPGSVVTFRGRVSGFIAPLIMGISAAFSSIGSFIGGLGFLGKLLMSGLSLAIKFLVNKLFAPKTPEKLPDAKTSYSIVTTRNQAAPWEAVPAIFGKHRLAPFYGALPYTEMSGDDQYLRCLFVWGYGPLDITDMKIGETLLSTYDDVEIETYYGYPADPDVKLYPNQVIEEAMSVELEDLTWQTRTTAENVQEISIDIILPNGLVLINSDGNHQQTVTLQWRYRIVGSPTWTTPADIVIKAKTRDAIRRTYRATVTAGQYEVEVHRSVAKKTYADDTSDIEDTFWTAIRGMRPGVPITFVDPVAVTAIRIRATSQLNGSLETFNGVVASRVTAWNGTTWVDNVPSQNPADLFRHALQGPMNKNPVTDAKIDLESLALWNAYCVAKGWKFNNVRVDRTSVYELILDICSAGRAMPVFKDGRWSVIWDEVSEDIVQMFTPRNSWGFEATRVYQQPVHGYRVRFVNEDKDYVEDERIVYDDGYNSGNATVFESLELTGVTNKDDVWKFGRYHIAQRRLRPEIYTITADFENIICTRGDRIRVAHDVMLVGLQSGRVKSINVGGQTVTIDEWVNLLADHHYMFRFRLRDGTFLTRDVVFGSVGELQTLSLVGTDDLPAIGDLFAFGESGTETGIYRVLSIEPGDELSAKIQFVDDAPAINDADQGAIPAFVSNVTSPVDALQVAPTDLRIQAGIYLLEGDQYYGYARLNWKQARQGNILFTEVQVFKDLTWQTVGMAPGNANTYEVRNLIDGTYTFRVRALYRDTTNSGWATSEVIDIGALLDTVAPNVTNFRIATIGAMSTLSWNSVGIAGERYEVRFAPVTIGAADWNAASTLVPSTNNTNIQVPTMVGIYFIKASSPVASPSAIAAIIASNVLSLSDLNAVETLVEQPTFTGGKSQIVLSGTTLRLAPLDAGLYVRGIYRFANSLDLMDPYTSRLSATIEAFGEDIHSHMHDWVTLSQVSKLASTDPDSWRVFLELRTTLGSPVDTVTRTGTTYAIGPDGYLVQYTANTPRYQWDPANLLADPVLMAEVGSTNLIQRSAEMDHAYWTKSALTVTPNSHIGSGGGMGADKLIESATNAQHLIFSPTITVTAGQPLTVSGYFSAGERSSFILSCYASTGMSFNLATQTMSSFGGATGTIEHLAGDIYKCTVSLAAAPGTTAGVSIYVLDALGNSLYLGDGTSGLWVSSVQLEQLAAATSHIATAGATASRGTETITFAADWSDWQPFVVGDVTFRAIQLRLQMRGKPSPDPDILYSTVTPVVNRLEVVIDMPDRVIADNDVAVGTAGLSIVFDPPFLELSGIATADQDMATGDRKVITAKSESGFTVRFFNSVGTPVARTIDWVAKGYGSKHI